MDLHAKYGGVVPEIAARSHIESITSVIDQALQGATLQKGVDPWDQIDGIAVTYGAGLGGCLLIGVLTARTLAFIKNKSLYGINHVEAHVYANFITETSLPGYKLPKTQPQFPMLALIVSGGHTQLVLFKDHFDYTLLGQTHDDAIGEAFDKVAKVIGLPYPGGPSIAQKAFQGSALKYKLPKAKLTAKYDFSFSGLKTAVLREVQALCGKSYDFPSTGLSELLSTSQKQDIAASFQHTAIETVVDKTLLAYEEFKPASVVIAGGVAANQELRHQLEERLKEVIGRSRGLRLDAALGATEETQRTVQTGTESEYHRSATPRSAKNAGRVGDPADKQASMAQILRYTDPKLCTDNGAMVAALGCYKMLYNQPTADPYSLEIAPNLSM